MGSAYSPALAVALLAEDLVRGHVLSTCRSQHMLARYARETVGPSVLVLRGASLLVRRQIRIVPGSVRGMAHTRLALRYDVRQDEATDGGLKAQAHSQRLCPASSCVWASWASCLRLSVKFSVLFIAWVLSALTLSGLLVEALVCHVEGVSCSGRRGVADLLDEGGPAVADDVEGVDGHGLVLAMAVVLGSGPAVDAGGNASLGCFLDLRCVSVGLSSWW